MPLASRRLVTPLVGDGRQHWAGQNGPLAGRRRHRMIVHDAAARVERTPDEILEAMEVWKVLVVAGAAALRSHHYGCFPGSAAGVVQRTAPATLGLRRNLGLKLWILTHVVEHVVEFEDAVDKRDTLDRPELVENFAILVHDRQQVVRLET